jgi:hypothetical protein
MADTGDLGQIPGIGKTFVKDFARIGAARVGDLPHADPERLRWNAWKDG